MKTQAKFEGRVRVGVLLMLAIGLSGCSPGFVFKSTSVSSNGSSITVRTSGEPITSGSGNVATQIRPMPPFLEVESSGFISLIVTPGESSVAITTDDNIQPHITTVVENGRLVVSTQGSFRTESGLTVKVSTPELTGASSNGSGNISFSEFSGQRLTVSTTGSGDIEFDGCQFDELVAHSSGSGDITGSGSIRRIDAHGSGSGDFDLGKIAAESAVVHMSGSGDASVSPTLSLDASTSGSGDVTYQDVSGIDVRKSATGSGDIEAH